MLQQQVMEEQTQCDILVVGSGIAAIAAGRRLLDAGRSVGFVELSSERPVRALFAIDPTSLTDRELSGKALDTLFFHTPMRHTVKRLFADPVEPGLEVVDGRIRYRDGESVVIARRLLIAAGPGDVEIPDIPGAQALAGLGVSTCTWSDAAFFTDPVVVVGDGDFAYESALFAAEASRDVVVMSANGPRVRRRSLRSHVEGNPRIRIEGGARVIGVRAEGAERLRAEILRGTDRDELEAGGVVFAGEPRYGAEVREIVARLAAASLGDALAVAVAVAGGLTGVDENDHEALVRDGFRAADALLADPSR